MTKEAILGYLKDHKSAFKNMYKVEEIGLFGSYARDEADESSDIDIFVSMEPDLFSMVALKEKIENDLHRPVDIIRNHKHIKPFLLQMIQRDIAYV